MQVIPLERPDLGRTPQPQAGEAEVSTENYPRGSVACDNSEAMLSSTRVHLAARAGRVAAAEWRLIASRLNCILSTLMTTLFTVGVFACLLRVMRERKIDL